MTREGVACAPLLITQVNSEPALGIPSRRFRELLRELQLPVFEIGKLRGVETSVLLEALRERAPKPEASESYEERLRRLAGLSKP